MIQVSPARSARSRSPPGPPWRVNRPEAAKPKGYTVAAKAAVAKLLPKAPPFPPPGAYATVPKGPDMAKGAVPKGLPKGPTAVPKPPGYAGVPGWPPFRPRAPPDAVPVAHCLHCDECSFWYVDADRGTIYCGQDCFFKC